MPQSRSAPTGEDENSTRKKYTNNRQVDDETKIKQVNKHKNTNPPLRNIEKKRISAENKEILQNYNNLEQIQQKIAVLSKQIKTILGVIKIE